MTEEGRKATQRDAATVAAILSGLVFFGVGVFLGDYIKFEVTRAEQLGYNCLLEQKTVPRPYGTEEELLIYKVCEKRADLEGLF
jgi:hypothetical protein